MITLLIYRYDVWEFWDLGPDFFRLFVIWSRRQSVQFITSNGCGLIVINNGMSFGGSAKVYR